MQITKHISDHNTKLTKDITFNVKDKIWDRNPWKSEVIGRCGGDEKNE